LHRQHLGEELLRDRQSPGTVDPVLKQQQPTGEPRLNRVQRIARYRL
jgi:hypothetical protein